MKIATVMFNPRLGDVKTNLESHLEVLKELKKFCADLILFPELSLTGYLLENLTAAVALKPNDRLFSELTSVVGSSAVFIGCVLSENGTFYNSYIMVTERGLGFVHRKIYPPTYGMFDESRYFASGQKLSSVMVASERAGVLICEDAWHPVLAAAHSVAGVALVLTPSASPARGMEQGEFSNPAMWRRRLKVYAESYNQFHVYVNRDGVEDGVIFDPDAFVISPLSAELLPTQTGLAAGHRFSVFEIDLADRESAAAAGGPWQNDIFSLNEQILRDARRERESRL